MLNLKVPVHMLAFLSSMSIWWIYPYLKPSHIESMFAVSIGVYVLLANYRRREIWPALIFIICIAAVQAPVTYCFFQDKSTFGQMMYFSSIMVFDFILSFVLWAYHCNCRMLQLVGATIKRPFIPQVIAMSMVLSFSSLMTLPVLVELMVNYVNPAIFTGPPFFYRNYSVMMNVFHSVEILAIWSMMLDAHYLRERLERSKGGSI